GHSAWRLDRLVLTGVAVPHVVVVVGVVVGHAAPPVRCVTEWEYREIPAEADPTQTPATTAPTGVAASVVATAPSVVAAATPATIAISTTIAVPATVAVPAATVSAAPAVSTTTTVKPAIPAAG